MNSQNISNLIRNLLIEIGEDPEREGLMDTPKRVSRMYEEIFSGYQQEISSIFRSFEAPPGYRGIVKVSDIPFYSLCEHHMLPFYGKISIEYIPCDKILGLSKFIRLVNIYSQRLQTQENLTNQIADSIEKYLTKEGCIVQVIANHLCMQMRGVRSTSPITTTVVKRGKCL